MSCYFFKLAEDYSDYDCYINQGQGYDVGSETNVLIIIIQLIEQMQIYVNATMPETTVHLSNWTDMW